jgi:parallel beta-helix repeat protein
MMRKAVVGALALLVVGAVGAAWVVERVGVTPRALAPYIEKRTSGHNPVIVKAGQVSAAALLWLDRGDTALPPNLAPTLTLGAQARAVGVDAPGAIEVATPDALRAALARAEPGDTITLLPGVYRFGGKPLDVDRPGRAGAPIVVRAARPGSVQLEFDLVEGFRVKAPHWRFENLAIRGICTEDTWCEHAFHVVGAASHFAAVNNTITDFNAHFKINGEGGRFPDDGLIEQNTLTSSRVRQTSNPVTPIDLVAASRWTIRTNLISDFVKAEGDRVSYGAFAKGGGSGNVFERNLIWCERTLRGAPGQRVGLSLGGGGTGKAVCRDGRCITEQEGSTLRANLVMGCSDVGMYLNSAARSTITDNTVLDTAGIDVRFSTSSARLDGNLVDGPIRSRDNGLLHLDDNRSTPLWQLFAGYHPARRLFADAPTGDLRWHGSAPARSSGQAGGTDLCGATRSGGAVYGAFVDFSACQAGAAR